MSLLTEDVRAWIGRSIELPGDEITEAMVREYVYASGDDHPAYTSQESADEAQVDRVAPPMLYYGATRPYVPLDHYAADGTLLGHRPDIGTGQSMGGTLSVEWKRPLRIGDRLHGTRTLVSLEEKRGARRHFVVVSWETEYRDQAGEVVIVEHYEQICF